MEKSIEVMRDVIKVQGYDGNWNYDPYMQGMYNGMELMISIAEGREPVYKDAPEVWLKDIASNGSPVAEDDFIGPSISTTRLMLAEAE